MKKHYYFYVILGLALVLALPSLSQAEETTSPSPTATISPASATVRDRIRAEVELKNKNIKINQTSRNEMLEKQRMSSGTPLRADLKDMRGDIKDARGDFRDEMKDINKDARDQMKDMRNGSSTLNMNKKEMRQEIELKLFNSHKDILVRQLNLALTNLKQIRERVASRITKGEQAGRNMTKAKALLVIADSKISAAQVSINTLANLTVTASSTTATTTATTTVNVKLDKPRQLGEGAIKAVKDAREALNEVVKAIAKDMGLHLGNATSTPPVSATTTATTTVQ
ncbi:MAG: hypothetical protein V4481_00270 [Patescibacteria group bacterium]